VKVDLTRRARRDLDNLDPTIRKRVAAALDAIASEPHGPGAVRLVGQEDTWRLRVGDWRVIYEIDRERDAATVLRVVHRREAYRS
jgi:mRNA interferase RelE/StbE